MKRFVIIISIAMTALVAVEALTRPPKVPAASWAEISSAVGSALHSEESKSASRSEPIIAQVEHVLRRLVEAHNDTGDLVFVARRVEENNRDYPIIWTRSRADVFGRVQKGSVSYVSWNAQFESARPENFASRFKAHLRSGNVLTLWEFLEQTPMLESGDAAVSAGSRKAQQGEDANAGERILVRQGRP